VTSIGRFYELFGRWETILGEDKRASYCFEKVMGFACWEGFVAFFVIGLWGMKGGKTEAFSKAKEGKRIHFFLLNLVLERSFYFFA